MKKFLVLLVALGALYYYKPGLFPTLWHKGAFDSKGHPVVLLFTQAGTCGDFCDKAVQELNARGVAFQELKLDSDDNIKRYQDLGGTGSIPFLAAGSLTHAGYDKGMYASVLSQTFGDHVLTRAEQLFYAHHFSSTGKPLVYMYGASWCGYCKVLRHEMEERKIDFVEVDVDLDADKALIADAMDLSAYPITYVGYQRIVGASKTEQVIEAVKANVKRKS